jgi:dTDP-4-dehydrorhamnose reductase
MRILIFGGDGMMGHQLLKHLGHRYLVRVTLRQSLSAYSEFGLFDKENSYTEIDVRSADRVRQVLAEFEPQAVVNAVGIVKQRSAAKESIPSLEINALFPHQLALLCKEIDARLVHMSTDCVFSGKKGNYQESDLSDAEDLYGRTKYLGEVNDSRSLTLRTSIIGRELTRKKSLLEWFLAQSGRVNGFKHAIFSGFTTLELSRIIEKMLVDHSEKAGLYHVSSDPISKYDLLMLIKEKMGLATEIIPDETVQVNRSLDSTKFRKEFSYTPPTWKEMVEELCNSLIGEKR